MLLSPISERLENEYGVDVFEANGSIDLGMKIKNASRELTERGTTSDGSRTFTGATLSSNDYEGS